MKKSVDVLPYDDLRRHVGHEIEINDVWDWATNRESGVEIRCRENDCAGCEPLLEADNPHFHNDASASAD